MRQWRVRPASPAYSRGVPLRKAKERADGYRDNGGTIQYGCRFQDHTKSQNWPKVEG